MAEPRQENDSERSAGPGDEPRGASSAPWTRVLPDDEPEELAAPRTTPTGGRASRLLPWALVTVLGLIALALFWSACEAHYQACVQAVDVRSGNDTSGLGRLARQDGVDRCTRAPF